LVGRQGQEANLAWYIEQGRDDGQQHGAKAGGVDLADGRTVDLDRVVVVTGRIDVYARLTHSRCMHRSGRTRAVETQVHVCLTDLRNKQDDKQNDGKEPGQHEA
jgi:hypothetical protein